MLTDTEQAYYGARARRQRLSAEKATDIWAAVAHREIAMEYERRVRESRAIADAIRNV